MMDFSAITQQIGANIAAKRKECTLPLDAVAHETGLSVESLQAIEAGEAISAAELYCLCMFFQCSPMTFMDGLSGISPINGQPDETQELMQNFLSVDQPNRGQLFSDFIGQFKED